MKRLSNWIEAENKYEISIEQKVALEVDYLHRKSIWLDIKIIILTFTSILKIKGISH